MNVAEVMNVIGDVKGRTCLVIDDFDRYRGTLVKTATALMENGASQFMLRFRTRCFRARGAKHFAVMHHRKSCDQHHSAERRGPTGTKNQVLTIAGLIGRAIQSSRRDVRQQIVLIGLNIYGNRN